MYVKYVYCAATKQFITFQKLQTEPTTEESSVFNRNEVKQSLHRNPKSKYTIERGQKCEFILKNYASLGVYSHSNIAHAKKRRVPLLWCCEYGFNLYSRFLICNMDDLEL